MSLRFQRVPNGGGKELVAIAQFHRKCGQIVDIFWRLLFNNVT